MCIKELIHVHVVSVLESKKGRVEGERARERDSERERERERGVGIQHWPVHVSTGIFL